MPDSIRKTHIDAVAARLALITIAGGYQTDIGERITHWNSTPLTERELQGIDITDPVETTEEFAVNRFYKTLEFRLDIHAKQARETAQYLRKAIADVENAIGVDRSFGITNTSTLGSGFKSEIAIDNQGRVTGGARITFQVRYRQQAFDPYNQ